MFFVLILYVCICYHRVNEENIPLKKCLIFIVDSEKESPHVKRLLVHTPLLWFDIEL